MRKRSVAMRSEIIEKSVKILKDGGLVAFPTETVYGLGGDASQAKAVHKIFEAKNRPADHPLIVHLADVSQLSNWARLISPQALKLAEAFWPGPLTLIFPKQKHVLSCLTGGQETIALRVPRHPIAQQLLQAFGKGIAAPSANQFTHLSPTTAQAVEEELNGKVDLILDGGECEIGLESTIVDMTGARASILRPGMITTQMIETVLQEKVIESVKQEVRAPGMHVLHYAPLTRTLLLSTKKLNDFIEKNSDEKKIAAVLHSSVSFSHEKIQVYHMPYEAKAYAHVLYQTLRDADHQQFDCIVIEDIPHDEAWDAIRDRLKKASGREKYDYNIAK